VSLHETGRHAIHSCETLSVTVETINALQKQASILSQMRAARVKSATDAFIQIKDHMESQMRTLQSLLLRSQSNKERLQNEISLVRSILFPWQNLILMCCQAYNTIAQRDSQVMTGLGHAAKQDSGAMRTIAVVTMAFLPPTFLSVGLERISTRTKLTKTRQSSV
jgi:hypothetical protein